MIRKIVQFFGKSLQLKTVLFILAGLAVVMGIFAFYDIQEQRRTEEQQLLAKGKILAQTGAATVSSVLEEALQSGALTREQLFDTNYIPIPNTNPQKYHTAYDAFTDKALQKIEDSFQSDPDVVFAAAEDVNGYLPTHNSNYSTQATDPGLNRTKRIFSDTVGLAAGQNTSSFLQQVYKRDTGEVMWDLSAPIIIDGQHWGGFRVGFSIQRTEAQLAATTWRILLSLTGAVLAICVISFLITRRTTREVGKMSRLAARIADVDLDTLNGAAKAMAGGDLSQHVAIEAEEIDAKGNDEIGEMAHAFNRMVMRLRKTGDSFETMTQNLRSLIGEIRSSAVSLSESSTGLSRAANEAGLATEQIAVTIQQVAQSNQTQATSINETAASVQQLEEAIKQISSGALSQVHGIEETSATISSMSISVQQVTGNSQEVAAVAAQAHEAVNRGSGTVRQTITGMQSIRQAVAGSAEKVKELGEYSGQIGTIVEAIDDIAEQTNLLALNAAIEAARAGEHGKGFAVVADEVRKLAERSSRATKEIATLISTVQAETMKAVTAMEQGAGEVESGVTLAENTGRAFEAIAEAVQITRRQSEEIAAAVQQMSGASSNVVKAMDEIAGVADGNTASAEKMAADSDQVSRAIEQIAALSQENSAAAEEVSAAAQEMTAQVQEVVRNVADLTDLADNLQSSVNMFRLDRNGLRCWDIMNCGQQLRAKCPAYQDEEDRCWLIPATWCGGVQQGDVKAKAHNCMNCRAFYGISGIQVEGATPATGIVQRRRSTDWQADAVAFSREKRKA